MGLTSSKLEGTSIPVDTRRECRNSVLLPGSFVGTILVQGRRILADIFSDAEKTRQATQALSQATLTLCGLLGLGNIITSMITFSYSELRAKLEESETALAEAKAKIGALKATIDGFEAKILMYAGMCSEEAMCPVCSKTFFEGGFHSAPQKLWLHMGHMDFLHLEAREKMRWNKRGWDIDPQTIMVPKKATPKKATPKKATPKKATPKKAACTGGVKKPHRYRYRRSP
jgi:hypothetical protein